MESFNLVRDPWVPLKDEDRLSLSDLLDRNVRMDDLFLPPITEAALIRLLLWIGHQSQGDSLSWLQQNVDQFEVLSGARFLQDEAAAQGTSSRPGWMLVEQQDGNSPALAIAPRIADDRANLGLGLLTAAMADRSGTKAQIPGVSNKTVAAAMAGNYVVFRYADTLQGVLEANQPFVTDDIAALLMWRWRRLFVTDRGEIVVANGMGQPPESNTDPFIGGKAKRRPPTPDKADFEAPIWDMASEGEKHYVYALATMQASPLSHYRRVYPVPPAPEESSEP